MAFVNTPRVSSPLSTSPSSSLLLTSPSSVHGIRQQHSDRTLPNLSVTTNNYANSVGESQEGVVVAVPRLSCSGGGGDYAGLLATFDSTTGQLQRVPEHMVPSSLLDWGLTPSTLEVLISEDDSMMIENHHLAASAATKTWTRYTTIIYPATGCGVDNLDTTQTIDRVQLLVPQRQSPTSTTDTTTTTTTTAGTTQQSTTTDTTTTTATLQHSGIVWRSSMTEDGTDCLVLCSTYPHPRNQSDSRLRIEVCFGWMWDSNTTTNNNEMDKNDSASDVYRSRIQVDLERQQQQNGVVSWYPTITPPVRVYLERQISNVSSNGTVAHGGGLDGRSVSTWLGPILSRQVLQSFAEQDMSHLVWSSHHQHQQKPNVNNERKDGTLYHLLPGNLTMAMQFVDDEDTTTTNDNTKRHQFLELSQIYPSIGARQVVRVALPQQLLQQQQRDNVNKNNNNNNVQNTILNDLTIRAWVEPGILQGKG